jgi:hypothetical protein
VLLIDHLIDTRQVGFKKKYVEIRALNGEVNILLTRDSGDLLEGELQQDLLLVVYHTDTVMVPIKVGLTKPMSKLGHLTVAGIYILLTRDSGDLWEGELQQDLLLVVHHIDTSPVHSDYHIILRQVGPWNKIKFKYCHDKKII